MQRAVLVILGGLYVGLHIHCHGLRFTQCQTNYIDLDMESSNNEITCTGAGRTEGIVWGYDDGGVNSGQIFCEPSGTCASNSVFIATRASASTSSTLTPKVNIKTFRAFYGSLLITCRTTTSGSPPSVTGQTSCRLDVFHRAEVTSCVAQFNSPVDTGWTVSGSCNVSKAFSQRDRYSCQWTENKDGSGVKISLTTLSKAPFDEGGITYYNMTCGFTKTFPNETGSYSYTTVISPGDVQPDVTFTGSSDTGRPNSPPTHTCPSYVPETQDLNCTCSTSDLGQPAGDVMWNVSVTNQLLLSNVDRTQNGQQYVCGVNWNGQLVQPTVYTLHVAYGPSSVTITRPDLPYDTDGSREMTLMCLGSEVNPTPSFTWPRLPSNNVVAQGHTIKFAPQPPDDDNSVFECRAENTVTGTVRSVSVTVSLNYPPTSDPNIITSTPSSSEGHLYQGDRVTLTCDVTGGKPVTTTAVTFTCPGKPDAQDSEGSTGVSSSVSFDPLTGSDHDTVCTCTTRWKQTNWYNRNNNTQIFVNTPPSSPVISPPSTDYPFMATVTQSSPLTCISSNTGRPASTYSWPIRHGGRERSDAQGRGTLTFDTVTKDLDGQSISCRASNRFTDHRQPVQDGHFTLQVYYHPEVTLTSVTDVNPSQCDVMTPDTCLVIEGQRVHFRCTADSNPDPAVFTWQPGNGNDPVLYIESANRTQHTGTYNCSVATGSGNHGNDQRLPLKGWAAVTVLVKYPASIISFTTNSVETSLTVTSGDLVTLTCRADGRPTPEMILRHPDGTELGRVDQGTPSLVDEEREITRDLTVSCRDTGVYSCDVSNGVGNTQQQRLTVFVQCSPQLTDSTTEKPPTIRYEGDATHVTFNLLAYPLPRIKTIMYRQPNGTFTGNFDDIYFTSDCDTAGMISQVRCNVTVIRMTSPSASGSYRATVTNVFGSVNFEFDVSFSRGGDSEKHDESSSLVDGVSVAIGASVMLVVVVVVVAAVVVWLWRRDWVLPCAPRECRNDSELASKRGTSTPEHEDGRHYQTVRDIYEIQDNTAQNLQEDPAPVKTEYELLRMRDVGQKSVYSSLDVQHTGSPQLSHTEPAYVNSSESATRHYANVPSSG